jgi:hypothetical protein
MPALSLVVVLYSQRDLLERLLKNAQDCYDDLLVVHDGPDEFGIRGVVEKEGGRFFERERQFQQEPHFPFAYGEAAHDWILHFDADEFPGDEMKQWLREFRQAPEPTETVAAYACILPLWNGKRAISKKWPPGHTFLFHRYRVKRFGMAEQAVVPEGNTEQLTSIIHHQPKRKTYDLGNILVRKQAYRWRAVIATALLGKPTDLNCWRWTDEHWPDHWEQIRARPLRTAISRLTLGTFRTLRSQWRTERRFFFQASISGPVHHMLICLKYWAMRSARRRQERDGQ